MASSFRVDPSKSIRRIVEIKQKSMFALETVAQQAAARMEAEAKRDAPWTDRTGLARQTIRGVHGWVGDKMRCGVTGNMRYSPYLELTHEGQNAVLGPTVQRNEERIKQAAAKVIR